MKCNHRIATRSYTLSLSSVRICWALCIRIRSLACGTTYSQSFFTFKERKSWAIVLAIEEIFIFRCDRRRKKIIKNKNIRENSISSHNQYLSSVLEREIHRIPNFSASILIAVIMVSRFGVRACSYICQLLRLLVVYCYLYILFYTGCHRIYSLSLPFRIFILQNLFLRILIDVIA